MKKANAKISRYAAAALEKIDRHHDYARGYPSSMRVQVEEMERKLLVCNEASPNYAALVAEAETLHTKCKKMVSGFKAAYEEVSAARRPARLYFGHGQKGGDQYRGDMARYARYAKKGYPSWPRLRHDFILPFVNGRADAVWGTRQWVGGVDCGIMGWSEGCCNRPEIDNVSDSRGGKTKSGEMKLWWSATVPADDIYYVQDPTQPLLINGSAMVEGTGRPGVDATARVTLDIAMHHGGELLYQYYRDLTNIETPCIRDDDPFNEPGDTGPQPFYFSGCQGWELGLTIRLTGFTWARSSAFRDAVARVTVPQFGVLSNWTEDLKIHVVS